MKRKQKAKGTETICPNCGHCSQCGRANPQPVQVAPWPYYPYPWYVYPTTTAWPLSSGSTTITVGDAPATSATVNVPSVWYDMGTANGQWSYTTGATS